MLKGTSGREVVFHIQDGKQHLISPPPGWERGEVRSDGAAWVNRKKSMSVIASISVESDGKHWLHVSCAHFRRMPTYEEMAMVKNVFVGRDKYAISVMPPTEKHVNIHRYCLHWWSCMDGHPLPEFSSGGTI